LILLPEAAEAAVAVVERRLLVAAMGRLVLGTEVQQRQTKVAVVVELVHKMSIHTLPAMAVRVLCFCVILIQKQSQLVLD
jgi:hypothetical protein